MKAVWGIITGLAILLTVGSGMAADHMGGAGNELQLRAPRHITIAANGYAEKEKLAALRQKLNNPDPFVRVEAVQALGDIEKEKSLVSIYSCLNDENLYVRAYAAEALGKIGRLDTARTLVKLLPALDDPSPYVRAMMIVALGELRDERAADAVREFLSDEDESVRKMAAWALNQIKNPQ